MSSERIQRYILHKEWIQDSQSQDCKKLSNIKYVKTQILKWFGHQQVEKSYLKKDINCKEKERYAQKDQGQHDTIKDLVYEGCKRVIG